MSHIHTPDGACCAPKRFAHLHQHTQYSLLDGAAKLKDLLKWVRATTPDDPSCAITDHGNMHGAVHFYNYARAMDVKPIIGYEAYVAAGSRHDRPPRKKKTEDGEHDSTKGIFHLTLLAQNLEGYRNLCRMNSEAWLSGFHYKPRTDHDLIEAHAGGVICLSGCIGSEVSQLIIAGDLARARATMEWYAQIFPGRYYVEIQRHGRPDSADPAERELAQLQLQVNEVLRAWASDLGLPMVVTNDGHYVQRGDAPAHDALLAIQTKSRLDDPTRFRFACDDFYVKTPQELRALLPESEYPDEAFTTTADIAARCEDDYLPVGKKRVYQLPALTIPSGRTPGEELRAQAYAGLDARYPELTADTWARYAAATALALEDGARRRLAPDGVPATRPAQHDLVARAGSVWEAAAVAAGEKFTAYPALAALTEDERRVIERTEYELGVINRMGFPDYFLIVADYITWAKAQGIVVGPGRGSGAGSIVAYALSITDLDPLHYKLLFERFLNPERVSMPDFDIDFDDRRRGEVVEYVRARYGEDKVAQIATFTGLNAKAVFKDVAKLLGVEFKTAQALTELIPVKFGRSYSLEEAEASVPEIRTMLERDGELRRTFELAQKLEGLTKTSSVHAAGIVIGREPLANLVPLMRDSRGEGVVTQYDMKAVEDVGLVKMDFLGLRTLTFLEEARRALGEAGVAIDFAQIPLDDPRTFEMISRGETAGVFQLEGEGITAAARSMRPRRLEDIIALSALYRPGPMENIPTYVRRHHGDEEVSYAEFPTAEPQLSEILKDTYGIPVYQEQIMQIASDVAGYTLGEADMLRRAMGKKDKDEMARQKLSFADKSAARGIPTPEAERLFALLEKFADYGFNRCVTGDTLVMDANSGRMLRVDELAREGRSLDHHINGHRRISVTALREQRLKLEVHDVTDAFYQGRRETFRVTTETGRTITATANHPFFGVNGWTNLEDLKGGDFVAIPRVLDRYHASASLKPHELDLLGYAISEGNLCHPTSFYTYTTCEVELQDHLQAMAGFDNTFGRVDRSKPAMSIYAKRHDPKKPCEATEFLRAHGLLGKKAADKHVPEIIFRVPEAQLARFLGKLWTGDGGIHVREVGGTMIHYTTASERLARDVQHLLLRLGIMARIHTLQYKYRGELRPGYSVRVLGGPEGSRAFAEHIGPHLIGTRAEDLAQLERRLETLTDVRPSKDVVPNALVPRLRHALESIATEHGVSRHQLCSLAGFRSDVLKADATGHGVSTRSLRRLSDFIHREPPYRKNVGVHHDTLYDHAHGQVYWDKIVSIEPAGEQDVYDLTVEQAHNFVANDFIVHNSHSAAYGVISYQTAWLRANHLLAFYAALLTVEQGDSDKVAQYVADARAQGVAILGPDINASGLVFGAEATPQGPGAVRFGLSAVQGLSADVVGEIMAERASGGAFRSVHDFCARFSTKVRNKRVLENLIKAGAFDSLAPGDAATRFAQRARALANVEEIIKAFQKLDRVAKKHTGMDSLFGAALPELPRPAMTLPGTATRLELLSAEHEVMGIYLSGHPLEETPALRALQATAAAALEREHDDHVARGGKSRRKFILAGVIEAIERKTTRRKETMAILTFSDSTGTVRITAFPKTYAALADRGALADKVPCAVVVTGSRETEGEFLVMLDDVLDEDAVRALPARAHLSNRGDLMTREDKAAMLTLLDVTGGAVQLTFVRPNDPNSRAIPAGFTTTEAALKAACARFEHLEYTISYDPAGLLGPTGRFATRHRQP